YRDPIVGFDQRPDISLGWVWWAFWLLPLDPARAGSFLEAVKRRYILRSPDGSAFVQLAPGTQADEGFMTICTLSLASQWGDAETEAALRAHVEGRYEPTWDRQAGEFYYGCGLGESIPRGQYNSHLMLSEVGGPGGWRRIFNEPSTRRFGEPT